MSWGPATGELICCQCICIVRDALIALIVEPSAIVHESVFIHRRLAADGSPVGPVKLNVLPSDSVEYDDEDDNSTAQIQVHTSMMIRHCPSV